MTDQDVTLETIGYTQLANLTEGRVDAAVVRALLLESLGHYEKRAQRPSYNFV